MTTVGGSQTRTAIRYWQTRKYVLFPAGDLLGFFQVGSFVDPGGRLQQPEVDAGPCQAGRLSAPPYRHTGLAEDGARDAQDEPSPE